MIDCLSHYPKDLKIFLSHDEGYTYGGIDLGDIEEDMEEEVYICPDCGHVFKQGEMNYNYDAGLLDFVCPNCDWEGNENEAKNEED